MSLPLCSLYPPIEGGLLWWSWVRELLTVKVRVRFTLQTACGGMSSVPPHSQCTWILSAPLCIWSLSHLCTQDSGPQPAGNAFACWCCESTFDSNCPWFVFFQRHRSHLSAPILICVYSMPYETWTLERQWSLSEQYCCQKNSPIAVILCVSEGYWEYTLKALEDAWAVYIMQPLPKILFLDSGFALRTVGGWSGLESPNYVKLYTHKR